MARPDAPASVSRMWVSHHYPEDYDRCIVVGRSHVCRRCAILYPIAFAVMALALAGVRWPGRLDAVLLLLLPVPAVVEFLAEHVGLVDYQARRQVVVSVPLAVALGVGFARYLHRQTDPLFWAIVVGYGALCLAAVLWGHRVRLSPSARTDQPR